MSNLRKWVSRTGPRFKQNPAPEEISVEDVNLTPPRVPYVPHLGEDLSKYGWDKRPIKDLTRHIIASHTAKEKKHLLVMPGSTGRDIELLNYYGVPRSRSYWTVVERDRDQFTLLKSKNVFSPTDKIIPHLENLNTLKISNSKVPIDFAWFDLLGNLTFKDIYWLRDTLRIHKDLDLFFTFSLARRGKQETHPVSILHNTLWNKEWDFQAMGLAVKNIKATDELKQGYDRKSNTRSLAMDRSIVTHQQLFNTLFNGWDFDLNCWAYDDTTTFLLYHLKRFRKSKTVTKLMEQVDLILEMAENYNAGYTDVEISNALDIPENRVYRWRRINRLPGPNKYKEYKMAEGFKTLLVTDDLTYGVDYQLCSRLEEFHPFINTSPEVRCFTENSITNIVSPRQKYKIAIGDKVVYSNDNPFSIQITPAFLHPQNTNALFSIFRCLFRGDEFLHPQLCSSAYKSGRVPCFILSSPQRRAINAWIDSYEMHQSAGIITLPTGMGKTVVATAIVDYLAAKLENFRVLVITSQKEILSQSIKKFKQHTKFILEDYYCRFYADTPKTKKCLQKPCVFATAASLHKSKYLNMISRDHFDLVIMDEMHHVNSDTWMKIAKKFKGGTYLLGLTATPFRGDSEKPAKIYDNNFLIKKSLNRGIWEGYLSWPDYRIFSDNTKYRGSKIRRDALCLQPKYQEVIFEAYMRETPGGKTIGFVPTLKGAEAMADYFTQRGIPASFVSSKQHKDIRKEKFDLFNNGDISVLFAVGILDEGVDIPDVEVILKLNKTKSPVKFLQQFGRGLRLSPGKRNVIILDFVENYQDVDAILNLGLFLGINTHNILQSKNYKARGEEIGNEEGISCVPAINFMISEAAKIIVRGRVEEEAPIELDNNTSTKIKNLYKAGYDIGQILSLVNIKGKMIDRHTVVSVCRSVTTSIDESLRDKLRYGLLHVSKGLPIELIIPELDIAKDDFLRYIKMIDPIPFRKHIKSLLAQGDSLEDLAPKLSISLEELERLLER